LIVFDVTLDFSPLSFRASASSAVLPHLC